MAILHSGWLETTSCMDSGAKGLELLLWAHLKKPRPANSEAANKAAAAANEPTDS